MNITFDPTLYGEGIEGFINWTNALSGNWMLSLFIIFISGIGYFVAKDKGLSPSIAIMLTGMLIVFLGAIAQLFTQLNGSIIIVGLLLLGVGAGGHFLGK